MASAGDSISSSFCKRLGIRERQWHKAKIDIQHFGWRDICTDTDLLLDQSDMYTYRNTYREYYLLRRQIHDHHHSVLGYNGDNEIFQFGAYFRKSSKKERTEKEKGSVVDISP